jgi:translation initiation factor 4G
MSRGGSRRGADRNAEGPDGWAVAGGPAATQRQVPPKAGDLSQFGKIAKPAAGAPMTFGPSSVFSKKEGKRETASMSRASSMNAFSILSQGGEAPPEAAGPASGKNSRAPSRKPSVDLGPGGAPEGLPARRKLNLLPRSKAAEEPTTPDAEGAVAFPSTEGHAEAEAADGGMSEADANKRIDEDLKEFFAIRNVDEGEDYFEKLPAAHHARLVEKVVSRAIESKEADAQLAADLFARAVEKELCTPDAFERGFLPIAELLDDIAIDAPKAFNLMALMLKGAGLADDEERRGRIAEKSIDADKLIALLS